MGRTRYDGERRMRLLPLALGCLLLASVVAVSTPEPRAADAYTVADLPPMPTYCHPAQEGTVWPGQVPGCSIGFSVSTRYDCCDSEGNLIEYGGPVFTRQAIGVTGYGSLSSPPTFVVSADFGVWPDDGLRRVEWKRLTWYPFLPGDSTPVHADPIFTCGLRATSCTYRFDQASMSNALLLGLGNPPKWLQARILVPVQGAVGDGDGQARYEYGYTSVAIGFYRTDNKTPVANLTVTPKPGDTISYHFDGRGSTDTDGDPIARYVWDFGDGTTAEGAQVDHTYTTTGNYRVKLAVLDPQGAQGNAFLDIGERLTITNVVVSPTPKVVGDEFNVTATVRNDGTKPLPCVYFNSNADIRPASSFTKISGPVGFETADLGRGQTLTKTYRFKLKAPVPATFDFVAAASGGGTGGCPGQNLALAFLTKTTTIGGAQPWAPFASWVALVKRQYEDVLGRVPTTSESTSWVSKLTAGTHSPGDLVDNLRRSADNVSNVDATARLYRALLGRTPDASGLRFWIGRRRSGTWTLVKMADNFAASSEFKRKYGTLTNRQFVTRIYTDVLGRPADPSGVDYWTRQLDTKRRSRGSVMVGFSESNEYKAKQAETVDGSVASIFLLGRAPDAADLSTWVTAQKAGTTHPVLLQQVLSSPAYATRISG